MKLAIMQPYLFPYIGYFQLIHAVDLFVIYDDVHYIKKGWINRNRILLNGSDHLFTLPLEKASQNKLINELYVSGEHKSKEKILQAIKCSYAKAPEFKKVYPLIEEIILNNEKRLSEYIIYSLVKICNFLDIDFKYLHSSGLNIDKTIKGQDRILSICKTLHATRYINPIGGIDLYDRETFERNNMKLSFLKTNNVQYKQFGNEFVPFLSIIDVLMFQTKEQIKELLHEYQLL